MGLYEIVEAIIESATAAGVVVDAEIAEPRVMVPIDTAAGGLRVEVYKAERLYVAEVLSEGREPICHAMGETPEEAISEIEWMEIPGIG